VIVIDTSALIAIIRKEHGYEEIAEAIVKASPRLLPPHVYLEFVMMTSREGEARRWLDRFIGDLVVATAEIDQIAMHLAADAFLRYGKGGGHPAQLNLADCLSYGVAKRNRASLLYKGDDFSHTDIESALAS